MNYLIEDEALELKYVPGKGAWTYHIIIPNSKDIKGKWGDIKVSGSIDGYPITHMNLAPMGDQDKRLSINGTIRKSIQKSGGDMVTVTLCLEIGNQQLNEKEIKDTFRESGVLAKFEKLPKEKQQEMLEKILKSTSEEKQVQLMVDYIDFLNNSDFFDE